MTSSLSPDQFGEDPEKWSFDVFHSSHDELQQGKVDAHRVRVVLSKKEFPTHHEASLAALQMMPSMPTRIMTRI